MLKICMDEECLRNYLLAVLNGLKKHLNFHKDFMKSCSEDSDIGYFLKIDVQYPEEWHEPFNNLPF